MILNEGGNVFKDEKKVPVTQRINRNDVPTTVAWLEQVTGLSLKGTLLGSTGVTPTSGDIDLGLDASKITKDAVIGVLTKWCQQSGIPDDKIVNSRAKGKEPAHADRWIDATGIEVHFRAPINGDAKQGYVQVDFNFLTNMKWSRFMLSPMPPESQYKGVDRAVLFNSIGKVLGFKVTVNTGVHDRQTNELVTTDPAQLAQMLVPNGTVQDLVSVETVLGALRNDPKRREKLADFANYLTNSGRELPQLEDSADPGNWFRFINQRLTR